MVDGGVLCAAIPIYFGGYMDDKLLELLKEIRDYLSKPYSKTSLTYRIQLMDKVDKFINPIDDINPGGPVSPNAVRRDGQTYL